MMICNKLYTIFTFLKSLKVHSNFLVWSRTRSNPGLTHPLYTIWGCVSSLNQITLYRMQHYLLQIAPGFNSLIAKLIYSSMCSIAFSYPLISIALQDILSFRTNKIFRSCCYKYLSIHHLWWYIQFPLKLTWLFPNLLMSHFSPQKEDVLTWQKWKQIN